MALGLPSVPPEDLKDQFEDSPDEYCPHCGWDSTDATTDHQAAFNSGIVLAIEEADGSPLSTMSGTQHLCYYIRCPGVFASADAERERPLPSPDRCGCHFTVELENSIGAMS